MSTLLGVATSPVLLQSEDDRLRQAFAAAMLGLGRRMYAAGIDDGRIGARLRILDERIRRAAMMGRDTDALRRKRDWLLVHLARLALEDDAPLPGADEEYRRAREAEAALVTA